MTKNILLALTIFCLVTNLSCDLFTDPRQNPEPGRRDYVWRTDTIYSPNNLLSAIYGASPNDLWLGGHGGPPKDRLWHYDGAIWKQMPSPEGQDANSIFGFSSNDIWLGANDGKIYHFDGNRWMLNYIFRPPNTDPAIVAMCGRGGKEIYALASFWFIGADTTGRSAILHYSGGEWKEEYRAQRQGDNFADGIWQDQQGVFLLEIDPSLQFFLYSSNKVANLYSKDRNSSGWGTIVDIGGRVRLLIGNELYAYIAGRFVKLLSFDLDLSHFGYQLYGRSEKDIFLVMHDGIQHYNGTDMKYVYHFSTSSPYVFARCVMFERDVFFVLNYVDQNDFTMHLIVHGILPQ